MSDEKFFAWLDGELDAAEAAAVEARVAADPELAALADEHRALRKQMQAAFNPIAAAPVPKHLEAAVRPSSVVPFRRASGRRAPSLPQWASMAAALALGIFTGSMIDSGGGDGPVEVRSGTMFASAGLHDALETQLASSAQGGVRIGLTFRDEQGALCRSFTNQESSGLACRDGERWRLRGLFAAPEGQGEEYRMAAGTDPALAALIDSSIAGEPLDARQEESARRRRWR